MSETPSTQKFTKTETLKRLRALARAQRKFYGLPANSPVEVGLRIYQHATTTQPGAPRDTEHPTMSADDDLEENITLDQAARISDIQEHGAIVHLYLSSGSGWFGELYSVEVAWIGTPDHDPVLLPHKVIKGEGIVMVTVTT